MNTLFRVNLPRDPEGTTWFAESFLADPTALDGWSSDYETRTVSYAPAQQVWDVTDERFWTSESGIYYKAVLR